LPGASHPRPRSALALRGRRIARPGPREPFRRESTRHATTGRPSTRRRSATRSRARSRETFPRDTTGSQRTRPPFAESPGATCGDPIGDPIRDRFIRRVTTGPLHPARLALPELRTIAPNVRCRIRGPRLEEPREISSVSSRARVGGGRRERSTVANRCPVRAGIGPPRRLAVRPTATFAPAGPRSRTTLRASRSTRSRRRGLGRWRSTSRSLGRGSRHGDPGPGTRRVPRRARSGSP
jgi:hypothetical protein